MTAHINLVTLTLRFRRLVRRLFINIQAVLEGKGPQKRENEYEPFCCSNLHLCLLHQIKHRSFISYTFCFGCTVKAAQEELLSSVGSRAARSGPVGDRSNLQITGLYLQYLCNCSELWATTSGCLSFWACCRVTLSVMEGVLIPPLPEGRLDTLHDSLYLYLSLLLHSLHVPGFAPSLPVNIPPFSCHQCLCPPSHSLCRPLSSLHFPQCAPPSHGREQVTGVETGALPGSAMQRADGPLCPFSRNVDRL